MSTSARAVAGGMLRERVRVLRAGGTITATGGTSVAAPVTVLDSVWACIEPLEMNFQRYEEMGAGGVQAQLTHRVRLRREDSITAAMWLQELDGAGRRFEIVIRRLNTEADELELLCQEKVS